MWLHVHVMSLVQKHDQCTVDTCVLNFSNGGTVEPCYKEVGYNKTLL